MKNAKIDTTSLLINTLEKEVDVKLDEQTINIKNTNLRIFLVKKGSPNEKKYSDFILKEIELNGEKFYLCR